MGKRMRRRLGFVPILMLCLVQSTSMFSITETTEGIESTNAIKRSQQESQQSWVSRLSKDEFQKLLGAMPSPGAVEPGSPPFPLSYPSAIDWRNKDGHNWVTAIKNQGLCGSCVAFAAVATLESLIRIELSQPNKQVDLSEMDVFHCGCGSCCSAFWYLLSACNYLHGQGGPDEECFPYQPQDIPCDNNCSNSLLRSAKISNHGLIYGQENIMTCVANAPIMAVMNVYEDFWQFEGGTIYQHSWGEQLPGNHAVCIIGYNTAGATDYWIIKNSWGDDWGEGGFARIKMGECGIETIDCRWMSDIILPLVPTAPSSLAATAVNDAQINLSWHDNSNNESGFEIQRKEQGGVFSTIATAGGNETSYQDLSVLGETTYYYQVRSYNVGGNSAYSNTASDITAPRRPSNLDATTLSPTSIRVVWTDNSTAESGFEIWQKQGSGSWQLKSTVGANVTSKDITGLQEVTTYSYHARAYNSNGNSDWSNTDSADTPPTPPTNLNATTLSSVSIRVVWVDNCGSESGYEIWQKEGSGSWQLKSTVGPNVTSKDITGLQPGWEFTFL